MNNRQNIYKFIHAEHLKYADGIKNLLDSGETREVAFGLSILAMRMAKSVGLWEDSLYYLKYALELSNYADKEIIKAVGTVCNYLKDYPAMSLVAYRCAEKAFKDGDYHTAIEALGFAWFAYSYKRYTDEIPLSVTDTVSYYESISKVIKVKFPLGDRKTNSNLRIGHVIFRLYDEGHSPTRLLRTFIKYHDYHNFDVYVYNSEDLVLRPEPHFILASPLPPSKDCSGETMSFLDSFKVPYYMPSLAGSQLDTAKDLANKIYADNVDVLIYSGSIMCPVSCLVSYLKPAPIQINMNIGASMFVKSLDCVTHFTKGSWQTEKEYWDQNGIRSQFMPSGVDYSDDDTAVPLRNQLNVPQKAQLLVTCGNLLPQRMSREFQDIVIALLKSDHTAYYLVIGKGDFSTFKELLSQHGLLNRVIFTGFRKDAAQLIKICDIYLNEFPEGGGHVVLEAMSASKPVVAMDYGGIVTSSAGASHVGEEFSIKSKDFAAYRDFAYRLIKDEKLRNKVGQEMRRRYETVFSPQRMVKAFEDLAVELYQGKVKARF